jgi:hypothetical protein
VLVKVNDGEKTMEKHVFQVFVSRDGVFLGTEMLAETQVRLGRDVPDGLRMDGEGWAPVHARLVVEDTGVWLLDVRPGLLLNGLPVTGPVQVSPRDTISVGRDTLQVRSMWPNARDVATLPETVPTPAPQGVDALLAFFDEDDAEHEEVQPHFSLAEHVSDEVRFSGNSMLAEMFELNNGGVRGYRALKAGERGPLAGEDGPLVHHLSGGLVRITNALPCAGTVRRGGTTLNLDTLTTDDGHLLLKVGDVATLQTPQGAFLVRLIPAPATLTEVIKGAFARSFMDPGQRKLVASSLGLSVLSHMAVLLGAWVLELRNPVMRAYEIPDEFAMIPAPQDPELVPPAPPSPPVETKTAPDRTKVHKHKQATPRAAVQPAGGQPEKTEAMTLKLDQVFKGRAEKAREVMTTATNATIKNKGPGGMRTNTWISAKPSNDITFGMGHGDGARPKTLNDYARTPVGVLGSGHGRGKGVTGIVRPEDTGKLILGGNNQPALPAEVIGKVVKEHVHEIQQCYERALFNNPGMKGKVKLEWTIGAQGVVTRSRAAHSDLNSEATVCMVNRVKAWKFPPLPGGNTLVTYPFVFRAVGF